MPRKADVLTVAVLACSLLLASSALAANGYGIPRSVIGGGGQQVAGGDYILNGTIGEPIATDLSVGDANGLSSGFWWPFWYSVYLPQVVRE